MAENSRTLLARLLIERYTSLRERLARRLGSQDLAAEALHETWIRLDGKTELGTIANPDAYLFRAAIFNASKLRSAEQRAAGTVDFNQLLEIADEAPDAERIAIAKSELAAMQRALRSLTSRQRKIFVEFFGGETSHADLAERFGVSVRTIQTDLRTALLHVVAQMPEKDSFAKPDVKVSRKYRRM